MTSPKVISGNSEFLILGWRSRGRPRRYLRGVVDGVSVGSGWQKWRDADSHRHRRFDFRYDVRAKTNSKVTILFQIDGIVLTTTSHKMCSTGLCLIGIQWVWAGWGLFRKRKWKKAPWFPLTTRWCWCNKITQQCLVAMLKKSCLMFCHWSCK